MDNNSTECKKDTVSKSWFCTFANPEEHGYDGTPEEIVDRLIQEWIKDNPQRTCAVAYCISADGFKHCHAVFEDTKAMRFSTVKKLFPTMDIRETKGSKDEAEDYIHKRGRHAESGEKVIYVSQHGDIKGHQGQRRDLSIISELLDQGKTPNEIMEMSISYRRHDKLIKDAYFYKRNTETPEKRKMVVYWHMGKSGTGKSHMRLVLIEKHGRDHVYIVTDYKNGFDKYNGEKILFMDEFRGRMPYSDLLVVLDEYKAQVPCRYSNIYSLWVEIHIASPFPPELLYRKMVQENPEIDTLEQLLRRISFMAYHYKENGEYKTLEVPMAQGHHPYFYRTRIHRHS